jgi:hypothetical protein
MLRWVLGKQRKALFLLCKVHSPVGDRKDRLKSQGQVWWHVPVIPAMLEAQETRSVPGKSTKSYWEK